MQSQDISKLKKENARLRQELDLLTHSKAYRLGVAARTIFKNPKKAARKVVKLGAKGPRKLIKSFKSSVSNVVQYESSKVSLDASYAEWRMWNDPTLEELDEQREQSKKFKRKPLISIITPVFKPPVDVLEELINSVLDQSYPYFELCMTEVAGDQPTRELLTKYAKIDPRIKVKFYDSNGGIASDSNRCLKLATGEYIALLDHDDLLSPNALFENAKLINSDDYDFLYSDKDKITETGERYEPLFKPGWSPEMMYNANYLTHLNVFKHSLVKKIGGWNSDTDGAQDWDLFLRLIKVSKKVGHIPKILYHWRVLKTSTAHSISTKPYALQGQRVAVERGASAEGVNITVSHDQNGVLSVSWKNQKTYDKIKVAYILNGTSEKHAVKMSKKIKHMLKDYAIDFSVISSSEAAQFKHLLKETNKDEYVLVIHDFIEELPSSTELKELLGWLEIEKVLSVSPHIVSSFNNELFDPGRLIGFLSAFGPFYGSGSYNPHLFGFKEWVRNVSAPSPYFAVYSGNELHKIVDKLLANSSYETVTDVQWDVALEARIADMRSVSTPYVSMGIDTSRITAENAPSEKVISKLKANFANGDVYFNSNLSLQNKGPQIVTQEEKKIEVSKIVALNSNRGYIFNNSQNYNEENSRYDDPQLLLPDYQRDSLILSSIYDYTADDLKTSRKTTIGQGIESIDTALWLLPAFTTLYAGLKNIFAYANFLYEHEGTVSTFAFSTNDDISLAKELIIASFPKLSNASFLTYNSNTIQNLPHATIAVCTLWTTAYDLLKYNDTQRKCYLIQDWEPEFYPKGTLSTLANETYKFGFIAIAGTTGLAKMYNSVNAAANSAVLSSLLDLTTYIKSSKEKPIVDSDIKRVLFYARPDTPRNAFELGLNALTKLKLELGDKVEIILAGSNIDSAAYDIASRGLVAAGKVPYDQLSVFYSSFNACLFLMYSEHPGVVPLEMMASGVPVVVNDHNNITWDELYIDGETCVRSLSSVSEISNNLKNILFDDKLSDKIIKQGQRLATKYTEKEYEKSAKLVTNMIKIGGKN